MKILLENNKKDMEELIKTFRQVTKLDGVEIKTFDSKLDESKIYIAKNSCWWNDKSKENNTAYRIVQQTESFAVVLDVENTFKLIKDETLVLDRSSIYRLEDLEELDFKQPKNNKEDFNSVKIQMKNPFE